MSKKAKETEAAVFKRSFIQNRISQKKDILKTLKDDTRSFSQESHFLGETASKDASNRSFILPSLKTHTNSVEHTISPEKSELNKSKYRRFLFAKKLNTSNLFKEEDVKIKSPSGYKKYQSNYDRKQNRILRIIKNNPCRIQSQLSRAYMEEIEEIHRTPMNIFKSRNNSIEEATIKEKYVLPSPRGQEFKQKIAKELETIKARAKQRHLSSVQREPLKIIEYDLNPAGNLSMGQSPISNANSAYNTLDPNTSQQASFFNDRPVPALDLSTISSPADNVNYDRVVGKKNRKDPFQKTVMFQNIKMPFKMALLAKTRRKMVEEIKVNTKDERYPVNEIIETVRGYSPREQQKFLDELEVIEKKKKKREYLNRDPVSNAYYNLCTLDKNAKERAIHKLELVLPFNCRYFK